MNIEIGSTLIIEDEELTVVGVKGRWVKLSNGKNISRQEASDGIEEYLEAQADLEDDELEDDEESISKMAEALRKYRVGYSKTISYSKGATLDNGDELAIALRGLSPADVCAIADAVYGELPGSHHSRYEHLNIGSRRMNAGNRIRGAIRKEIVTLVQVLALTGAAEANSGTEA